MKTNSMIKNSNSSKNNSEIPKLNPPKNLKIKSPNLTKMKAKIPMTTLRTTLTISDSLNSKIKKFKWKPPPKLNSTIKLIDSKAK